MQCAAIPAQPDVNRLRRSAMSLRVKISPEFAKTKARDLRHPARRAASVFFALDRHGFAPRGDRCLPARSRSVTVLESRPVHFVLRASLTALATAVNDSLGLPSN